MENIGINSISISISDLSLHQIFCCILGRILMSRRCSHGNWKSMGFGCKWRRESPTIKGNIVFSFIIVCPVYHYGRNGWTFDSGLFFLVRNLS
ncbi:hypothetical protein NC651_040148 [Populus alba x Populus x berolinensis]|nr:hypothetical protein NC651_040148 [Populus alba x Populus x berolinensis]